MDARYFLPQEALKVLFEAHGWRLLDPKLNKGLAILCPDFYPNHFVIANSKKSKIESFGETEVSYKGKTFDSVDSLLRTYGEDAISDFHMWNFTVQKEWVIYRNGEFISTFDSVLDIPTRTKLRC
tara:strand:+ start:2144 stop:2518 length:375 start_codon:yes stop_codon:yes gene_type:complete